MEVPFSARSRHYPLRLGTLIVLAFLRATCGVTYGPDVAALRAFNNEVARAMGSGITGWFPTPTVDPCDAGFAGVYCTRTDPSRVYQVLINFLGLSANTIAPLANLTALRSLNLQGNAFRGSVPPEFRQLTLLTALSLDKNFFSGPLPDLRGCPLKRLTLSAQAQGGLTGPIPASLGSISTLTVLDLSFNSLSGPIPLSVARLPKLLALILHSNRLGGRIPYLGALAESLQTLQLSRNAFDPQPIPRELNNLTRLAGVLDLSYANLEGPLVDLSYLGQVSDLILAGNRLSGRLLPKLLPQGLLGFLSVRNNNFSGPVYASLAQTFAFPVYSQSDCGFDFANNSFSGALPTSLGTIVQAYTFDFSNNRLSGPVPDKFSYIYAMLRLKLANNSFSGPIPRFNPPPSIGYQLVLREADLSNNFFSGAVPPGLTKFTRMQQLDFSRNRLYGVVPDLSSLPRLRSLKFAHNFLSGTLPRLPTAGLVDLSFNYFAGGRYNATALYPNAMQISLAYNCAKFLRPSGCAASGAASICGDVQLSPQRGVVDCARFCRAASIQPPCSGHGTCFFWRGKYPTCRCDPGFLLATPYTCRKKQY